VQELLTRLRAIEKIAVTLLITITFLTVGATVTTCKGQKTTRGIPSLFAVAALPTPVLHTPDFHFVFGGKDGTTLHLDKTGIIREVEFIALPQTVFKIEDTISLGNTTIYKITTDEYPYPSTRGYFIDSRFVTTTDREPVPRPKILPTKEAIIKNLLSAEGSRYLWGGNYREGIPQMLSFYCPSSPLSQEVKAQWTLQGIDCSGLLYEATHGCTPRNTSSLIAYGEPVKIAGLNTEQIIKKLEPLDLMVWAGHVIIVLDKERTIESRLDYDTQQEGNQGGVRIRTPQAVVNEILKERIPVNSYDEEVEKEKQKFVIRRWYERMKNPIQWI
jgi:hypothetical protein